MDIGKMTAIELSEEMREEASHTDMVVSNEKDSGHAMEHLEKMLIYAGALKTVLLRHPESRGYGDDTLGSDKIEVSEKKFVALDAVQLKALVSDLTHLDKLEQATEENPLIAVLQNALGRIGK